MWSVIKAFNPACLLNRHRPVRLISPSRYLLDARWVRISQCRICGRAIFRYSGLETIHWRVVQIRDRLTEEASSEERNWLHLTARFSNDTRLKLTPIERELIDPEKRRSWIADILRNRS